MKGGIPTLVKWAGGKKQLIDQFELYFPKKVERYIEPFVGGGAVAFHIIKRYEPKEVIISDINEELINAYNVVKTDVENLIPLLKKYKEKHSKEEFYKIREIDHNTLSNLEKAARFIYLNKTCFNGLYRVNSKGKFNVPMGSYKNPNIIQEEKLIFISKLLKNVEIKVMSFENIISLAKKEDFIYFDPPYYPLKNKDSFTTYTRINFLEKDHEELSKIFQKLDKKDCLLMKSNSNTNFIKSLYSNYKITQVNAKRMINCDSNKRGKIKEIVIRNY